MAPRSVKEWVGKTPDSKIPPRVRQRIWDRAEGICHICKSPIAVGETWHADHRTALIIGGENRESNLAPAHAACNAIKGRAESKVKAKIAKVAQRHSGARQPNGQIRSRGFATGHQKRTPKPSLPPRQLFARKETEA